jgi:hypothetical protein
MRPARTARVVLALFALIATPACGGAKSTGKDMKKLEVPAGGITLAYDLTPGASYEGRVRMGNTQQVEGLGSLSQSLACDVKLLVIGEDPTGAGAQVRATLSNIELEWGLPPSAPFSVDEFTKQAVAQLQGMQVTFNVLPTGEITQMPTPPQELSAEVKEVVYQVLRALEQGFLVVPKHKVDEGESWTEKEKRGREGKLGRYVDGEVTTKVEGMFRHDERAEDVVSLRIEQRKKETITTKDGARTSEIEGKSTALFSTKGYLAEVNGETREYDPKQGMNFRKLRVDWRKTASGKESGGDVQVIADPCHPDYVGPLECTDAELPEPPPVEPTTPSDAGPASRSHT